MAMAMDSVESIPEPAAEATDNLPMSFPAILRNPKLADRFAHLRSSASEPYPLSISSAKRSRDDREGKRWVRRKENARFSGNPHVVAAGVGDLSGPPPPAARLRRTFPEPLPRGLSRSMTAPTTPLPVPDARSADAGRYSMGMRGVRRSLRGHGPRAQALVHAVEREVLEWLVGGMILNPDSGVVDVLEEPGRSIGGEEESCIQELLRTPLKLVWSIQDDAFARYIVHCCARYHSVVSFSKDVDGRRLTYLLRPNVMRPDFSARDGLDTPPATESDYSLGVLSETDIISVEENDSLDSEGEAVVSRNLRHRRLSSVSERSDGSVVENTTSRMAALGIEETADIDADDDESLVGEDLVQSVESLDIDPTPYKEPPIRYTTPQAERTPLRDRRGISRGSSSSPSRSPCPRTRRTVRMGRNRISMRRAQSQQQTFYDYVYS